MRIEMGKQYRTRGGYEVRIYAIDCGEVQHVHGAFYKEKGWASTSWNSDGSWVDTGIHDLDLIEVKPRIQFERWCNIYRDNSDCHYLGSGSKDKETATRIGKDNNTIACVKITIDCEEGEGL